MCALYFEMEDLETGFAELENGIEKHKENIAKFVEYYPDYTKHARLKKLITKYLK
jgi:hypothetical protein